ncbi:MAG: WecB/TagA/CpsF family glycosyltransferase [Pirellulaceae bacterium]
MLGLIKSNPLETKVEGPAIPSRRLFGVDIHALDMRQAVETIRGWMDAPTGACRYVVTPNVDHVVLMQHHAGLRQAYAEAGLVLADGWPVVLASRLLGRPLPERVAGSDLVPALFSTNGSLRVFLLGAAPGVADCAAAKIRDQWPSIRVVGTCSPRLGFESIAEENREILERINRAQPDLLIIGLGAPKQELWIRSNYQHVTAPAALCVGATIDFLAGHRRRAPLWMQRRGLEWFYRMIKEPRRLAWRYAYDARVFPQLLWRELRR